MNISDNTSKVWRVASKYSLAADVVADMYELSPKNKTVSVIELWTAPDFELWIDGVQVEKKPNPLVEANRC